MEEEDLGNVPYYIGGDGRVYDIHYRPCDDGLLKNLKVLLLSLKIISIS